jgi:hypothetical protein
MSSTILTNFSDSIKYLIDVGRDLSTLTGNDDRKEAAYWVKTQSEFSKAIIGKISSEYNKKNIPEEQRFLTLKNKFREIYETFSEELNKELILEKKINDEWLKITDELNLDEAEFNTFNRGLKITILSYDEIKKKSGKIDIELPISEIYRNAIYVDKLLIKDKVIKSPKFIFCVIYGIYNCFKFSMPSEIVSPFITNEIENIISKKLIEKDKGSIDKSLNSAKKFMAPIINSNKESFTGLVSQMKDGICDIQDEDIDKIADQADKAIKMFTNNKDKDLTSVMTDMLGGDKTKIKEKLDKIGLHEGNIRGMIDKFSGGMSNEDLKSSIPRNIEDFIFETGEKEGRMEGIAEMIEMSESK